jgi:cardiolipin synthase
VILPGSWHKLIDIAYLATWPIIITALFVVPRNRKPGAATAWLMLIVLLPYVGAILYLLIGSPKLSRRRRAQQRLADSIIADRVARNRSDPALGHIFDPAISERHEPFVRLNKALGGLPACAANEVELIAAYDKSIDAMAAAVDEARSFVHLEFYILALDRATEPFIAALERAARRGVAVRLLVDHVASRGFPRRRELVRRLNAAGIDWRWSLPLRPFSNHWNRPDLRNHRKLLVVDGRVAFTGSLNMIDSSYSRRRNLRRGHGYVEVVTRLTGPIVTQVNAVFLTDWYSEGGTRIEAAMPTPRELLPGWSGSALCQILPSGPGYDTDNNLKLFTSLIHAARRRVFITTPYFVPDDSLLTAIVSTARRGVEVTLLSSQVSNQFVVYHAQRSYYEELLRAGVRIMLLQEPAILHAKHVTIDDDIAVIGSSNLDMRSFTLNLEITLVAYDEEVVDKLREVEQDFLARSVEVREGEWLERPLPGRLLDGLARLTAALQ